MSASHVRAPSDRPRPRRVGRFPALAAGGLLAALGGCADSSVAPEGDGPEEEAFPAAHITWLQDHRAPLASTEPGGPRDDLAPFGAAVAGARVVALGEATHGTREFFRLKHRILEYLVEEQGVRHFAMEATWPEMNRIDDWVGGGEGDPAELLSGQYFWTWNTEAVMDLVLWARAWNEGRPEDDRVHVLGFDMQYAGMAIHNVVEFLASVDAEAADSATSWYGCYAPFANDPSGRAEASNYHLRTSDFRDACRVAIDQVAALVDDETRPWADAPGLARASRSARLVQQHEEVFATDSPALRDFYMAENVEWLLDQAGSESRIVLWAHNFHVSTEPGAMGAHLGGRLGAGYYAVALTFGSGRFTAVRLSGGGSLGLQSIALLAPPLESYEALFAAAGDVDFFLDLRGAVPGGGDFLRDPPRRLKMIGCCHDGSPLFGYPHVRLTDGYDGVAYLSSSTPTRVLPFQYPATF